MKLKKITEDQRDSLIEILTDTERLDKISISLDPFTKDVTVVYADMDEEWFKELMKEAQHKTGPQ